MPTNDADDYIDPVIEAYMDGIDVTLLLENLKLTPEERIRKAEAHYRFAMEIQGVATSAGEK